MRSITRKNGSLRQRSNTHSLLRLITSGRFAGADFAFVLILFGGLFSSGIAQAEPALLLIGASYATGSPPFNDNLQSPLGGVAVGFGSYLSLGDALVRNHRVSSAVINEAEAGATTFSRKSCFFECGDAGWNGYPEQLQKALRRVAIPDPTDPARVLGYNAKYVVISLPVDCLHSEAFGIPQRETEPCGFDEMNDYIERLIGIAERVLEFGLKPVFTRMPRYGDLDLPLAREKFGLLWVINEVDYDTLRNLHTTNLREKDGILVVDAWNGFRHRGDGLHPDSNTAQIAAQRILYAIYADERCEALRFFRRRDC